MILTLHSLPPSSAQRSDVFNGVSVSQVTLTRDTTYIPMSILSLSL